MSSSQQPGHHRLEAAGRDAGMATENSQQPTRDGSQSDAVTRSGLAITSVNNVTGGTGDRQVDYHQSSGKCLDSQNQLNWKLRKNV